MENEMHLLWICMRQIRLELLGEGRGEQPGMEDRITRGMK